MLNVVEWYERRWMGRSSEGLGGDYNANMSKDFDAVVDNVVEPKSFEEHMGGLSIEEFNFKKYKTLWENEKAAADKSCLNPETGRFEKGYASIPPEAMEFVEHRRELAQKQANGEEMTMSEKMEAGRDGILYKWNGYELKPDCCYRKISKEALKQYQESGFVDNNIDLRTMSRKDGTRIKGRVDTVDWFLGATTPRYGDVLIETPASEKYFVPVEKPGGHNMLTDTEAIHMHSSGIVDPIPMSEVRVISL